MTLALASGAIASGPFSVVTLSAVQDRPPVWHDRLRWPVAGDADVRLDLGRGGRQSIWAAQIDDAVLRADRAVLFVAEGAACLAASWWARLSPSQYVSRVGGALLFDPDEAGRGDDLAAPRVTLPFPSVVVMPDAADAGVDARIGAMVESWGSRTMAGGRSRTRSHTGWRNAQRLVMRLTGVVVANDIARARALRGE